MQKSLFLCAEHASEPAHHHVICEVLDKIMIVAMGFDMGHIKNFIHGQVQSECGSD